MRALGGKTRIAVKALYDLAVSCRGRQAQAKEIAARQGIPLRTLEEVLQDLRKAGLIEAQRGPRGGYTLERAPETIAVSEIVRALEGPVEGLFGLDEQKSQGRDVPDLVWEDLAGRVADVLDRTTLRDFVARAPDGGGGGMQVDAERPPTIYVI